MEAIQDFYHEEGGPMNFMWERRSQDIEFLSKQLTFEMVKQKYYEMILNKDKR